MHLALIRPLQSTFGNWVVRELLLNGRAVEFEEIAVEQFKQNQAQLCGNQTASVLDRTKLVT